MKNRRGFTIVEILVVIGILSLIGVVAIPSIIGIQNNMNTKAYDNKTKLLEKAATLYAQENRNEIKESLGECDQTIGYCHCDGDSCVYEFDISVQDLIDKGYYDAEKNTNTTCEVLNPTDKSCMTSDSIKITMDASQRTSDAEYGKQANPNGLSCYIDVTGPKGTNGWYVGNVKLTLHYGGNLTGIRYGLAETPNSTNNTKELPVSTTSNSEKTYYGYVTNTNGESNDCTATIKIDQNAPSEPNISFTSDYSIAIGNGSNGSDVDYYYSEGCSSYEKGTSIPRRTTNTSTSICAYAQDQAGNRSRVVQKNLSVTSTQSVSTQNKYYCASGYTYQNGSCVKTSYDTLQSSTKYTCSLESGTTYSSLSSALSACNKSETGTKIYYCPHTGSYQSSATCKYYTPGETWNFTVYSCKATTSTVYQWGSTSHATNQASCVEKPYSEYTGLYCSSSIKNQRRITHCNSSTVSSGGNIIGYTLTGTCYNNRVINESGFGSYSACQTAATNGSRCNTTWQKAWECKANYSSVTYRTVWDYYYQDCLEKTSTGGTVYQINESASEQRTTITEACMSGYTQDGELQPIPAADACPTAGATCTAGKNCKSKIWKRSCTKTVSPNYQCSDGSIKATDSCTKTGTTSSSTTYYCNSGYTCSGTCTSSSTCSKTDYGNSPTTKYYCSLTGTEYTSSSAAASACSNYCASGSPYSNKCYSLT